MKKVFVMLSLMLAAVSFSSCSNDNEVVADNVEFETPDSYDQALVFQELQDSIEALNMRTFQDAPVTRGWLKKFCKWFVNVINADLSGAMDAILILPTWEAAAVGAGVSSLVAAFSNDNAKENLSNNASKVIAQNKVLTGLNFNTGILSMGTAMDSIGYYHNKVVLERYLDNPEDMNSDDIYASDYIGTICNVLEGEVGCSENSIKNVLTSNSNVVSGINSIQNIIYEDKTLSTLTAKLCQMNIYSVNELNLFSSYVNALAECSTEKQAKQYTQDFINLIKSQTNSNNCEQMKRITVGIIVAYASCKLWDELMS